jgi:hypothetical protein
MGVFWYHMRFWERDDKERREGEKERRREGEKGRAEERGERAVA